MHNAVGNMATVGAPHCIMLTPVCPSTPRAARQDVRRPSRQKQYPAMARARARKIAVSIPWMGQ